MAYDIFFLSYQESNAEENWKLLRELAPTAKRVDNIVGLQAAHTTCAKRSLTSHFFVVDADNQITDPRVFEYRIPSYDAQYAHLWYAANPVNGLKYGWGGIKLFPKKAFKDEFVMGLDLTTSLELKIIPQVASTTCFNSSPYDTWRSAFREACKLTIGLHNGNEQENIERLAGWKTSLPCAQYGEWSIRGAIDGEMFARQNADIHTINDWNWLQAEFTTRYHGT